MKPCNLWLQHASRLTRLILILLLLLSPASRGENADLSQSNPEAYNLINTYFDSLREGDLTTLSSLLAKRESLRIKIQLQEPGYSQYLADRYRQAQFAITAHSILTNFIVVDITIQLNPDEQLRERLYLKGHNSDGFDSWKIYTRREILD